MENAENTALCLRTYVPGPSRKNKNRVNSVFNSSIFILSLGKLDTRYGTMIIFLYFSTWIFFHFTAGVLSARLSRWAAVFSILLNYERIGRRLTPRVSLRTNSKQRHNERSFFSIEFSVFTIAFTYANRRYIRKWIIQDRHGPEPACSRKA